MRNYVPYWEAPADPGVSERFVGHVLTFSFEPYNTGTARIEAIRPNTYNRTPEEGPWPGKYSVTFRVLEGKTRNRLFQHVSFSDDAGKAITLPSVSEDELQRWVDAGHARYVYPV